MKNKTVRKALSVLCVLALMMSLSAAVFAEDVNGAALEEAEKIKHAAENIENSFVAVETETDVPVTGSTGKIETKSLELNMMTRDGAEILGELFTVQGNLTESETTEVHFLRVAAERSPALKVVSSNANIVAVLFPLDVNTMELGDAITYDAAGDNFPTVYTKLAAGYYVLGVYSVEDSAPSGSYTLMWNSTNPADASAYVYASDNLSKVILAYSKGPTVYCNGTNWLTDLEWEEHYTLTTSTGHFGRDQSISDIKVRCLNTGSYHTNLHSTDNALFISAGKDSLWMIMRSQYSNVNGQVSHVMNYFDATGRETPRRFDSLDMKYDHYIVIDMDTNELVDFVSPYNYLWQNEQTTGTFSFARTNILNQTIVRN